MKERLQNGEEMVRGGRVDVEQVFLQSAVISLSWHFDLKLL